MTGYDEDGYDDSNFPEEIAVTERKGKRSKNTNT
jgi:hypothetical protein